MKCNVTMTVGNGIDAFRNGCPSSAKVKIFFPLLIFLFLNKIANKNQPYHMSLHSTYLGRRHSCTIEMMQPITLLIHNDNDLNLEEDFNYS